MRSRILEELRSFVWWLARVCVCVRIVRALVFVSFFFFSLSLSLFWFSVLSSSSSSFCLFLFYLSLFPCFHLFLYRGHSIPHSSMTSSISTSSCWTRRWAKDWITGTGSSSSEKLPTEPLEVVPYCLSVRPSHIWGGVVLTSHRVIEWNNGSQRRTAPLQKSYQQNL